MRAAPSEASSSTAADTTTSRASVATPNHNGTAPWTVMAMTAVTTSTRSATGSSTLPTVDTWWKRRATKPSTQSVAPSTAEQHGRRRLVGGPRTGARRRAGCRPAGPG